MTIRSITTDTEALTITVVADVPVAPRRLWDAYVDPRQLERFWGPPTWPATFMRHDVRPQGRSEYHMTGPDGEQSGGYWEFLEINAPYSFEVRDGFSHADGTPNNELPTVRTVFTFEESTLGALLTATSHFNSAAEIDQLLEMGMLEGTRQAMEQMDAVVTDEATYSGAHIAQLQRLDDNTVRVTRVIRAPIDQVWRAHHEPELVRQWMIGPDGWVMVTCELPQQVGDTYRYEWETDNGTDRFGFTGELLESAPPHREVTTESMIGVNGPATTNALNLIEVTHGTLLTTVITYPSTELRDVVLDTGMVAGMEDSYSHLESIIVNS
jgi:uncharacterized protein YndB with AHSA1/START domain